MEQVTNEDLDYILLRMKKEKTMGDEDEGGNFGMGFSVCIPEEFEQADGESASNLFWSEKRPGVILTSLKREEGVTFQFLNEEIEGKALLDCRKIVKQLIEQIDRRCVFYSEGEESEAVWFDYKSFAENKIVYNLVFLFQAGPRKVLGTFFCLFEEYDKWKPRILKMLKTIKTKEETDERL
ncbi:MAG: hypothetical protein HDQ97_11115 [Lachnospiraceae bacterium]|nr:hypothetical protein [Lachnospiraceae bacterium]